MKNGELTYVRFGGRDFISVRKRLLSSTVDTINMLKGYKALKKMKTEEFKLKKDLANELKECNDLLNNFLDSIPRVKQELQNSRKEKMTEEMNIPVKKTKKYKKQKVKKESKLDSELESIKAKLSALG